MEIKVWRNPYDTGVNITTPKVIDLQPGLTVLVGCNGAGKTTLIRNIEDEMRKSNVPYCIFDNTKDGGMSSISALIGGYNEYAGDSVETGAMLWNASEGEAIKINVSRHSSLYKEFLKSGHFKNATYRIKRIFADDSLENDIEDKRRIFLFDATDSGMSIDAVLDLKAMFTQILNDAKESGLECYIVIAANEYEMCRDENCFDVNAGKYKTFTDYESYRNFIIKSRAHKIKRLEKEHTNYLKKQEKDLIKYKKMEEKAKLDIEKIQDAAKTENRNLTFSEKYRIDDIKRNLKNFAREHNLIIPQNS